MPLIKLENKTPAVYTQESRDFQLLCRLFDCIVNGVKYDIDSMVNINDTMQARGNILALLQTKVGFFTEYDVNDDIMRYILAGFPEIIKAKGSIKAIKEAINVFLKAYDVVGQVTIWESQNEEETHGGIVASDHTLIIGLDTVIRNIYVLEEIFKYIIPTGYGIKFYFYNRISQLEKFMIENKAKLIFASNNINSILRPMIAPDGTLYPILKNPEDTFEGQKIDMGYDSNLNAVGTLEIISSLDGNDRIMTDDNRFLGFFQNIESIVDTIKQGDYFGIIDGTELSLYYRKSDNTNLKLNYLGVFKNQPEETENGDVFTVYNEETNTFDHKMNIAGSLNTSKALYALCTQLVSSDVSYKIAKFSFLDLGEFKTVEIDNSNDTFTTIINPYEGRETEASVTWDSLNKKIIVRNIISLDGFSIQNLSGVDIEFRTDCSFESELYPAVITSSSDPLIFNTKEHTINITGHVYNTMEDALENRKGTQDLPYQFILENEYIEEGNLYAYNANEINLIVHCIKSGKFNSPDVEQRAEVRYLVLPIIALSDLSDQLEVRDLDNLDIIGYYDSNKKAYVDNSGQLLYNLRIYNKGGEQNGN